MYLCVWTVISVAPRLFKLVQLSRYQSAAFSFFNPSLTFNFFLIV